MAGRDGSHHRGVVDDVVGGVVGHVLLDRDLGDVVDLVVDLVPDMLDNRGGVDNRGGSDGVVGVGHGLSHGNSWGGMVSVGGDCGSSNSVVSVGHGVSHGNSWGGMVSVGGDCRGGHSVVSVGSERVVSHSVDQLRVSLGQRSSLAGSEERESNLAREYRGLDREGGTFLPRTS